MSEQRSLNKAAKHTDSEGDDTFRFRNYDLIRRIDVGGMGEVYLARQHTAFDREVAIKIIRSDLVHDITVRKRFRREAEVNAHIKHGHILPLVEFGEEDGRLFFVTPYVTGGTLSRRLQAGPLSLSEVHEFFTALVEAVAYVHRRGVVHRDLKPSNILLDEEGDSGKVYVYLIDFGIASIQGMAASPPLTTDGTSMGTLAFMAPERLSGVAAPSNDIYSLGVILYQMLTGQLPTNGRRIPLPQPLEYVVNHCIAPVGKGRFTTAEEVLQAFEHAYQKLNTPTSPKASSSISLQDTLPAPDRTGSLSHDDYARQDVKTLQRTDNAASFISSHPSGRFIQDDYEAPTSNVDFSELQSPQTGSYTSKPIPVAVLPPRPAKSRKNPILAIITTLIVIVLLAMAGLFFIEFQPAVLISASVNFGPQVRAINPVFTIKGNPSQTKVNINTATIPVQTLSLKNSDSQSGQTTTECVLPPNILCQQVVTQADIDRVSAQLKQSLESQIKQELLAKLQSSGEVQVSAVVFTTTSTTADPPVGSQSKTVTVSMTEQGQVPYFLNSEAKDLARQSLDRHVQQLGPNFSLINALTQIGQPVVTGEDSATGIFFIKVPTGGVTQYHFPAAQLHDIQLHLKSMKLKDATIFLKAEQGVDAQSVSIHLSSGDTMPASPTQIRLIPTNPTNFPPVELTPIPTPTASATPAQ